MSSADQGSTETGALRRVARSVVALRIVFGVVWAIDAYLKWQPSFADNFMSVIAMGSEDQPGWLSPWFSFWRDAIGGNPRLFAYGSAVIETVIAVGLLFGVARRVVYVGGAIWSLAIWSIPEGFGTPFMP